MPPGAADRIAVRRDVTRAIVSASSQRLRLAKKAAAKESAAAKTKQLIGFARK
ncbi:MAG: hypothetical protein ACREYC_15600 [Gammaproteobacteria bacterium]